MNKYYCNEVFRDLSAPLDKAKLDELFYKMSAGDISCREDIILHNLKLVIFEINLRFNNTIYEKEELINEGIVALIRAVDTYDIDKNKSFSTYAIRCIDNHIFKYLKYNQRHFKDSFSLDTTTAKECSGNERCNDNLTLKTALHDDYDFVDDIENKEMVNMIFNYLNEEEKYLLIRYFGIGLERPMLQKEIGEELGVSSLTISKKIRKALSRVRGILKVECNDKLITTRNRI